MNTKLTLMLMAVSLTASAMGQFTTPHYNDWPSEVNFQSWTFDTSSRGTVNMAGSSFNKVGGQDIPGFRRWTTYSRTNGDGTFEMVNFMQYAWGTYEVQVNFYNAGANEWSPVASTAFNGSSLNSLNLMGGSSGFITAPTPPTAESYVNGLSPSGTSLVGGANTNTPTSNGTSGVHAQIATELNKGLTFQNGEWTANP